MRAISEKKNVDLLCAAMKAVTPKEREMPFNLTDWKMRFKRNAEEYERNASMDSGWSARTADDCSRIAGNLWRELAVAIAAIVTHAEDFFDRPDLVAVQEAARWATREAKP